MGPSGCDDDHQFGDEKYQADGEHSDADCRGPGEVEVRAPVENYECETAEEQDGTGPAAEACGDFALAFVLGAANLTDGLDGQTLMVIDATAKRGDECDLLGCVLFSFCQGAEDGAGRAGGGPGFLMVRREGLAGVEDRVLGGGHALVPARWLRVGVKEQQRA